MTGLVNGVVTTIALAVFAEQRLNVFGILPDTLLITVIAIDKDYQMSG